MVHWKLFKMESADSGRARIMREYGFQRLGSDIVMRLQMRIC